VTDGVTIGQAAAFAEVTVKTVRHYHLHGLLDEPRRDSSRASTSTFPAARWPETWRGRIVRCSS
jgi:hypothetical protein